VDPDWELELTARADETRCETKASSNQGIDDTLDIGIGILVPVYYGFIFGRCNNIRHRTAPIREIVSLGPDLW